ncbi:MAG TPA: helix-turn-helix domain-containing protein [Bryobacteraceae bacterium]
MKRRMFDQLLQSVKEGGAILRSENKTARRFTMRSPQVKAVREKTSLSQSEFACLIGVSVKTLQNWEQDRRRPTGPAVALLRIIGQEPKLAIEAIHRR